MTRCVSFLITKRLKMEVFNLYFQFVNTFLSTTWIWMPFVLPVVFVYSWMYYIQRFYWRSLDWVMLEVKPPREIERTPKTMEQVFAGLWGSFGTVSTKYEKYMKGKLQDYFSFEIVGANGEIHFYIRALRKYRDLVEAQIYSQYPQAEIKEVEDYAKNVPYDLPNKNWDLWGTKLKLDRESIYPLRTYVNLIDVTQTRQPNFLDPLAGLMENLGKLKQGEQIWIQLVFRATDDKWREHASKFAEKFTKKMMEGEKKPSKNVLVSEIGSWAEAIGSVANELITNAPSAASAKKEEKPATTRMVLMPAERSVLEGIVEKASKKGYEAKLQWVYIGRKEVWNPANIAAIMGLFNQFSNLSMNTLKPDGRSMTKANYAFAKFRKAFRQRKLMRLMRQRSFWEKGYILNLEELATIYHFPTVAVQSPVTPYIATKKAGAPVDLPLE